MDRKRIKKFVGSIEKREVLEEHFEDAVKRVLLSDVPEPTSSRNREPTQKELKRRYRLDRD